MIKIDIDASDLEAKIAKLDVRGMRRAIGVAVAEEVRNVMAAYPPASRRKQPFVSDKQRRYVMMLVRQGRVPYQRGSDPRSETLGRKWQIQPTDDGAQAVNTASYSDLVQGGQGRQARYHAGTWKTEDATLESAIAV